MKNNRRKTKYLSDDSQNQLGFTLIEMLIAIVIFLIVTSSIYGLLSLGTVSKNRSSRRTDVLKNARAAIHLIGRDALNAGLSYHQAGGLVPDDFISKTLGLPTDTDTERDILTSVIAGDNLFTNNLQDLPTDRTDIIAFAFRDNQDIAANGGDTIKLKTSMEGSAPDVLRIQLGPNSDTSNIKRYDLVLVEASETQVAAVVSTIIDNKNFDLEANDPLEINLPADGAGNNRNRLVQCGGPITDNCTDSISSLKRFTWVSYKVKEDGTLVRIVYGNNRNKPRDEQIQEQPLAYNVKDLQFTYVLEDGTVTSNPAAGPDGVAGTPDDRPDDFNRIRQITVTIEVASTENDEQTGKPEIIKLTGTFSARNLEYDQG